MKVDLSNLTPSEIAQHLETWGSADDAPIVKTIKELQKEADWLREDVHNQEIEISNLEDEIGQLQDEIEELEEEISELKEKEE